MEVYYESSERNINYFLIFGGNHMDNQSCFKEFARYTILSVLGTLGVSCYILADTFFVSKGLGTNGLAALNLAIPVYNFIHGTGLMLGMGGATRFSVCKSQKYKVNEIYTNTLYLGFLFSAFFSTFGLLFSKKLALILGADKTVLQMTDTYLRWLLLFAPGFIFNDILLCFVRNDESPQLSMIAMLTGSFSNILLDYIFIFLMKMGIFGAVFATGVSPIISMLMMLFHWIKKKNSFHFIKIGLKMEIVRQDISLGFPSFIAQISAGIVMIAFNGIILHSEGNIGVAAYGVIANISLVTAAVCTGIAQGVQPLISHFYGLGNKKQIQKVLQYAMTTTVVVSGIIYLIIFIFAEPIASVFNSENHVRMQQIAVEGLKLYFTSIAFVGYNTVLATFFTSVEKALPAHILSIFRGLVLIIPMAFLLSDIWGITGVWMACPLTEFLVAFWGRGMYGRNNKEIS